MSIRTTRRGVLGLCGAGVCSLAGCLGKGDDSADELDRATEKISTYTDVSTALDGGYEMSFPYVVHDDGVLGMPFINHRISEIDPEVPNILWYNLAADGTFDLLGAKWYVPLERADDTPTLFGEEFDGPIQGETPDIPDHFGLSAWVMEENSAGMFAPSHADVDPPDYLDALRTVWDSVTPYFSNEELAFDDGYLENEDCVHTDEGDYGIPLVNPDWAGVDLAQPGVLLYRFGANWSYRLQGVEWYVSTAEVDEAPELFGQQFHAPMEGHTPDFPAGEHYGLHAWLFAANPDGIFSLFTPREIC